VLGTFTYNLVVGIIVVDEFYKIKLNDAPNLRTVYSIKDEFIKGVKGSNLRELTESEGS